jgi:hypothetical protein
MWELYRTRPWGRVQHASTGAGSLAGDAVSILTRPWGRVQRATRRAWDNRARFQSSPARGGGCNVGERGGCGGLDAVSILTRPWGRVQQIRGSVNGVTYARFQSSPARGGGCNSTCSTMGLTTPPFQSSPARGGGCNKYLLVDGVDAGHGWFQSSPARGGGCNAAWRTRGSGSPNASVPVVKVCRAALWAANGWEFAYGHKVCSVTPCGGVSTCTE